MILAEDKINKVPVEGSMASSRKEGGGGGGREKKR